MWAKEASFTYMSGSLKDKRREFRVTIGGRYKVLLNGKPIYLGIDADAAGAAYQNAFTAPQRGTGESVMFD